MSKTMYIKKGNMVVRFEQNRRNERTITCLKNSGCTYTEDQQMNVTAELGNSFYKGLMAEGYVKATADDFNKIVRGY